MTWSVPSGTSLRSLRLPSAAHSGSVLASGYVLDAREISRPARQLRVLCLPGLRATYLVGEAVVVVLVAPQRVSVELAPGAPLVEHAGWLSSAPLSDRVLKLWGAPPAGSVPRLMLVQAGVPHGYDFAELEPLDISDWIDVEGMEYLASESLAPELPAPLAPVAAPSMDLRARLGVSEASAEQRAALGSARSVVALIRGGAGSGEQLSTTRPGAGVSAAWADVAARGAGLVARLGLAMLSVFNVLYTRTRAARPTASSTGLASNKTKAALGPDQQQEPSWLTRMRASLQSLAARGLSRLQVGRMLGRRQAEYLLDTMSLLERGDWEEGLRRAIPLGNQTEGSTPPALGLPTARQELTINPVRSAARSSFGLGEDVYDDLRTRYRRAFQRLEGLGEFEKAAFVLAELLGENEEAVSFLERHGRLKLAAELAEARGLAPGLVVRQWFLAGEHDRAIAFAKRTLSFADAVSRLASHPEHAQALRMLWADDLASAGNYASAVEVGWGIEELRGVVAVWIDRALAVGGISSKRMLIRQIRLHPTDVAQRQRSFEALREALASAESSAYSRALSAALTSEIDAGEVRAPREAPWPLLPADAALCARLLTRRLARQIAEDGGEERALQELKKAPGELGRMLRLSADPLLAYSLRNIKPPAQEAPGGRCSSPCTVPPTAPVTRELALRTFAVASGARGAPGIWMSCELYMLNFEQRPRERVLAHPAVLGVAAGLFGEGRSVAAGVGRALQPLRSSSLPLRDAAVLLDASLRGAVADLGAQRARSDVSMLVATLRGGCLLLAQVGVSVAYLLRGGRVSKLLPPGNDVGGYDFDAGAERKLRRVDLQSGDRLFFGAAGATSGWSAQQIEQHLSETSPELAATKLGSLPNLAEAPGGAAVLIADVEGAGEQTQAPPNVVELDTSGDPVSPILLRLRRSAQDIGAVAIHDAVLLPSGKLLLAMGELGAWILQPSGSVEQRFAEPAHRIVLSMHGDRALLLARRGERNWRISRLDLVQRRVQPWRDARLDAFADAFDGSWWWTAEHASLHLIDVTADWLAAQTIEHGRARALFHDASGFSAYFGGRIPEIWGFDADQTLRERTALEPELGALVGVAVGSEGIAGWEALPDGAGASFHLALGDRKHVWRRPEATGGFSSALNDDWVVSCCARGGAQPGVSVSAYDLFDSRGLKRFEVALESPDLRAMSAGIRLQGGKLLIFDSSGRLMCVDLDASKLLLDARLVQPR